MQLKQNFVFMMTIYVFMNYLKLIKGNINFYSFVQVIGYLDVQELSPEQLFWAVLRDSRNLVFPWQTGISSKEWNLRDLNKNGKRSLQDTKHFPSSNCTLGI